jgi:hypothetical protein
MAGGESKVIVREDASKPRVAREMQQILPILAQDVRGYARGIAERS